MKFVLPNTRLQWFPKEMLSISCTAWDHLAFFVWGGGVQGLLINSLLPTAWQPGAETKLTGSNLKPFICRGYNFAVIPREKVEGRSGGTKESVGNSDYSLQMAERHPQQ